MFRETNFESSTSRPFAGNQGVLRHPDGSIDFDAYRRRALRARRVAIAALIRGVLSRFSGAPASRRPPQGVARRDAVRGASV